MTLTLNSPTAGRCGIGTGFEVHTDVVGPVPADDYLVITAIPTAGSLIVAQGNRVMFSNTDVVVVLGWFALPVRPAAGERGLVDNAAFRLQMDQYHANGTHVDSGLHSSGLLWDAVSNLWAVIDNFSAGHDPMLDQVLAAVRKRF